MSQTRDKLDWSGIKHFVPSEFDDPDWPGSYTWMSSQTIILLDQLREHTGRPGWPIITHNKHGVHGCVCMSKAYHSANSFHNHDNPNICSAVDFHFRTTASAREQAFAVMQSGFTGIGIYQGCWRWPSKWADPEGFLSIGFHVDLRKHFQVWKYEQGEYIYLLQ